MNIIAYRLPGETEPHIYQAGQAEKINFTDSRNSFIISPFNSTKCACQYPLLKPLIAIPSDIIELNDKCLEFKILDKREYFEYLAYIKEFIGKKDNFKVVASRRIEANEVRNGNILFQKLCMTYPEALVFFISTKEFGTWTGASPELLLERKGNTVKTMSLAGTRPAGTQEEWDIKNIMEQKIVTDYIATIFDSFGITPHIQKMETLSTGRIEHLKTMIEGNFSIAPNWIELLASLSPTPALSGFPKKEAIEIINKYEGDRYLYGGFMGPLMQNGDFRLNVILRCAYLRPMNSVLFAGGGITYLSKSPDEWLETEKKLDNIKRLL